MRDIWIPRHSCLWNTSIFTRYISMHTDTHTHTHIYIYSHLYLHKRKWIYIYIYIYIYVLIGWLVGFYGISTFVGYLTPKPFYANDQFYFKQFSLAWVHSLIVNTFQFQTIQFIQTVLTLLIQFSINAYFVYTQLNVKIFIY